MMFCNLTSSNALCSISVGITSFGKANRAKIDFLLKN